MGRRQRAGGRLAWGRGGDAGIWQEHERGGLAEGPATPRGLKLLEVEDDERVPSKQAAIVDSKPSTSPPGEKAVMTPERQRRAHRPDGAVHLEGRGRL